MVVKQKNKNNALILLFESSVNSYGGKTSTVKWSEVGKFESSVNSYGGKTIKL